MKKAGLTFIIDMMHPLYTGCLDHLAIQWPKPPCGTDGRRMDFKVLSERVSIMLYLRQRSVVFLEVSCVVACA